MSSLLLTLLSSSPQSDEIAAVFPPWWTPDRVIETAAASGDIVGLGFWRSVVVVRDESANLAGRLRLSGAWVTLDAHSLAGCAPLKAERLR